jgi:XTP/dITP diphosphohydrolase
VLEFLLASGNAHKAEEFAALFAGKIRVLPAPRGVEIDETGSTYADNALLKARGYYEAFKQPALADDSGLIIDALPDILGVQSARFLPEVPSYADKCAELLRRLENVSAEARTAHFTCVLCFYLSPTEVFMFEGRVHGRIGRALRGDKGFGYDPIFVPDRAENDGLSLAELPEWKNAHSHRAKASQNALTYFTVAPRSAL